MKFLVWSLILKKIEEMFCVLKKGKQKMYFERKISFHDLNESKSLLVNHLLKKLYFWILSL